MLLILMQQKTPFNLCIQSCPLTDFHTKYFLFPFSNAHHFSRDGARTLRLNSMSLPFHTVSESYLFCSRDGARTLRLDSMSLTFHAVPESHLFCSIERNRRFMLTYVCSHVKLQIFLTKQPLPSIFKCSQFLNTQSQDAEVQLNVFIFSSCFRIASMFLNLV